MLKLILLTALAPALASASEYPGHGSGSWKTVATIAHTTYSTEEFLRLKAQFPGTFQNVSPENISSANVLVTRYEFVGESNCPAGDARLRTETISYGYCQRSGTPCLQTVATIPAPFDPCAGK